MATPTNRSPWQVKLAEKDKKLFRLKSQAVAHLAELGYSDPEKLPNGSLRQLETAFEVIGSEPHGTTLSALSPDPFARYRTRDGQKR